MPHGEYHGLPTTLQLPQPPTPPMTGSPEWRAYFSELHQYHVQLQEAIRTMYKEIAVRANEMITHDALADRPDAGATNRIFLDEDTNDLYFDTGTGSWVGPL